MSYERNSRWNWSTCVTLQFKAFCFHMYYVSLWILKYQNHICLFFIWVWNLLSYPTRRILRVFENRFPMYTIQTKFHFYAEVKYSCYCTIFYRTQSLSVAGCEGLLYQILPTQVNKYLRYRQKFISNLSKVWWGIEPIFMKLVCGQQVFF